VEYYHTVLKPLMAEWAYLWLQKQHLFGIDRQEAVRYMLEGAAARSDVVTKINLIELAITKTMVSLGDVPPLPMPTLGYQKSMSEMEKISRSSTIEDLHEQTVKKLKEDAMLEKLLEVQLRHLNAAKEAAESHHKLVRTILYHIFYYDGS
jgi:hypothetical protein